MLSWKDTSGRARRARHRMGAALALGLALAAWALAPAATAAPGARGSAVYALELTRNGHEVMRELALEQGKSAFVKTGYAVKRVSVGNPSILDVVVLGPRELHFVPKSPGNTNVVLWDRSGAPQAVIDVAVGTPNAHIESELRRILGNPDIRVDSAGDAVILKGSVSSTLAVEQAVEVAEAFLAGREHARVINLLEVGGGQQVMIKVVVAEMSRNLRRQLGTNFAASIESGGKTIEILNFLDGLSRLDGDLSTADALLLSDRVNLLGNFLGFGSGAYQVFLDVLQEKGLGKVLAEPTVVARSGQSASFLVGGEVPIPVAQGGAFGSISIEFKKFGVGVAFTPTVLSPERIHLEVTPEVSEPNFEFGTSVEGTRVPAFNTRRVSTGVELGDGQSFAIAGLLSDNVSELVRQYPVLGDIPVLGALFRSSSFERQETELVLIVTPHIVRPLGPGPHPLPTDHFIEPNDLEWYLLGRMEGQGQPATRMGAGSAEMDQGGLLGESGHRLGTLPEGSNR